MESKVLEKSICAASVERPALRETYEGLVDNKKQTFAHHPVLYQPTALGGISSEPFKDHEILYTYLSTTIDSTNCRIRRHWLLSVRLFDTLAGRKRFTHLGAVFNCILQTSRSSCSDITPRRFFVSSIVPRNVSNFAILV